MCCSSVLILCHCQHRSAMILFLVTRGVRNECPFTFKISSYGIWFFPALRGSGILTTAVLNSRVKRKPDKEMSVFIQFNTAPCFFLPKKKKAPEDFKQKEMSFIQHRENLSALSKRLQSCSTSGCSCPSAHVCPQALVMYPSLIRKS